MASAIHVGFLLYPHVTQLDLTGPAQVLSRVPGAVLHLVWKELGPVPTDSGFSIVPGATLASCPALDVVCVPGGPGVAECMTDAEVLEFVRRQCASARFVTSVCTGSLLLAAAGVLTGYEAACHWAYLDLLPLLGAKPKAERVVRDRNRVTGGGVTAGIDFGLALAAELAGEETARMIQLALEYDPSPPFASGSPGGAEPDLVARFWQANRARYEERRALVERIRARS